MRAKRKTDASTPRCTPMPSTKSSVSLKPAVSATTTGNPPISSVNSRTSRVVPGIGVTIDAGRLAINGRDWVGRRQTSWSVE